MGKKGCFLIAVICILAVSAIMLANERYGDTFSITKEEVLGKEDHIDYCYWDQNKIRAVMKNNTEKTICQVEELGSNRYLNRIHFFYQDRKLYFYDNGLQKTKDILFTNQADTLEEDSYIDSSGENCRKNSISDLGEEESGETGGKLGIMLGQGRPRIVIYDPYSGKTSKVKIRKSNKKLIQDVFIYQKELCYLADYDNSRWNQKGFWLNHLIGYFFADSVSYISAQDCVLNYPVAGFSPDEGISPLRVSGVRAGRQYYYPTIDGIYRYDLETGKDKLIKKENNINCDRINLLKAGNYYYQIKREIQGINSDKEGIDRMIGYTEIQKLDLDFQEVQKQKVEILPQTICMGEHKLVLSQTTKEIHKDHTEQMGESGDWLKTTEVSLGDLKVSQVEPAALKEPPGHVDTLWVYSKKKNQFKNTYGNEQYIIKDQDN